MHQFLLWNLAHHQQALYPCQSSLRYIQSMVLIDCLGQLEPHALLGVFSIPGISGVDRLIAESLATSNETNINDGGNETVLSPTPDVIETDSEEPSIN